jgi:hypothetical protein
MGLPKQGHEFHPIGSERTSALFRELKDKNISGITYSSLLEKMSNAKLPLEEFLQCFVLYRIGNIMPHYGHNRKLQVPVLSGYPVQKIKSINWSKLTLDHLLECIANFKLGKTNLEGNLPLLQVWYWEKLRLTNIDTTLDYSERQKPFIQH